ncbi:diguanylate cyclase domain-containing protein [Rhodococcus sp. NPDC078407]|uniref:GGDEF domain-containing protein n=1 Tax=Rhodococcus sp. NPDC078407 TaxID=3364509 RepID=UPI0037CA9577
MRLVDHAAHPGAVHGIAGLQTRLLRYYLVVTTALYAAGVTVTLLPHGGRSTAVVTGGVLAVGLGIGGVAVLWLRPRTAVGHRVALIAAVLATPAVMAFHTLASAQSLCLIAAMFLAMYVRAFLRDRLAHAVVGVLVVLVLLALWWAPAPTYPITYPIFGVAIVAAGGAFGVVTKALIAASCTDPLTGVFNRAGWEMETAKARAGLPIGDPVAVVIVDVDNFKRVNDTQGHRAGDDLLVELAQSWTRSSPRGAVIARLGGDEFAALLAGHPPELMDEFARATTEALPFVSVGTAWSTDPGEQVSDILARADAELYRIKQARREQL